MLINVYFEIVNLLKILERIMFKRIKDTLFNFRCREFGIHSRVTNGILSGKNIYWIFNKVPNFEISLNLHYISVITAKFRILPIHYILCFQHEDKKIKLFYKFVKKIVNKQELCIYLNRWCHRRAKLFSNCRSSSI